MSFKRGSIQSRDIALISIHIPKAGGTTLHKVIERQYPKQSTFTIDGLHVRESIEQFKSLPREERARIQCLTGHMPFGLHTYLSEPTTYITMLRDPIDRIISHYYFVKRAPRHYLYKEVISRNMDLEEYVSSGISSELNNGQVRLISGVEAVDTVFGHNPVSTDILEVAKRNLCEHFIAVGLCERFDESLFLFSSLLGWKNIYYVKENVTQTRPSKQEIRLQTLKTIEKHNELDMELYEFAKHMFEEKLCEQGLGKNGLVTFRLSNRAYGVAASWMKRYLDVRRGLRKRLKLRMD